MKEHILSMHCIKFLSKKSTNNAVKMEKTNYVQVKNVEEGNEIQIGGKKINHYLSRRDAFTILRVNNVKAESPS